MAAIGGELFAVAISGKQTDDVLPKRLAGIKRSEALAELKVCTSTKNLRRGKNFHVKLIESGNDSCIYVATALVTMYAKCKSMADARQVFDGIEQPGVVAWNALILGYVETGEGVTALDLFGSMKSRGCVPSSVTYVAVLKACSSLALTKGGIGRAECLKRGKEVHSQIGWQSNIYVLNTLINMYCKCGSVVEARRVFDGMKHPDAVSWTALILGYAERKEDITVLDLFSRMRNQGCAPTSFSCVAALKACISLALKEDGSGRAAGIERGTQIHLDIGCYPNVYVQSTLIDMYGKFGNMADARQVFDSIKNPDMVSWNALISGYAENGESASALDLFARLKSKGYAPDSFTCVAALKACSSHALKQDESGKLECLARGKQIHMEIGCHLNAYVQNTLIDMYANCGSMVDARQVFHNLKRPDVVSWNALILGYAENGGSITALEFYAKMKSRGYAPDSFTFVAALKACSFLGLKEDRNGKMDCLSRAKEIHSEIGSHLNTYVQNSLIDTYANCGSMVDAYEVFESMQHPDVVSWNALIAGYAENGEGVTALDLFARMISQGYAPSSATYVAVLGACGLIGALESGSKFHAEIVGTEIELDLILVTCLVDFYAKCGSLVEAQKVFDSHPRKRDLRTWTALLSGYSRLGDNKAVFGLFQAMQDAGFQPDGVAFLCVLTCCSHAGLVVKANTIFKSMLTKYGTTPTIEHCNCMVDIFGRSNKLDDAIDFLWTMPCKPDLVTWMTVLSASRKWKNVEIGRLAFKSLGNLNEINATAYVLMAHLYGSRGMYEEQKMVLEMRKEFKVWKEPGQSYWTNEVGEVHVFLAGENNHPQIHEIQQKLRMFDFHNITNEVELCGHSEKLAIACALLNTELGKTVRIFKNLRICHDCHTAAAQISEIEHRTVICRDASKFHVFKDGKCSCGDFW